MNLLIENRCTFLTVTRFPYSSDNKKGTSSCEYKLEEREAKRSVVCQRSNATGFFQLCVLKNVEPSQNAAGRLVGAFGPIPGAHLFASSRLSLRDLLLFSVDHGSGRCRCRGLRLPACLS